MQLSLFNPHWEVCRKFYEKPIAVGVKQQEIIQETLSRKQDIRKANIWRTRAGLPRRQRGEKRAFSFISSSWHIKGKKKIKRSGQLRVFSVTSSEQHPLWASGKRSHISRNSRFWESLMLLFATLCYFKNWKANICTVSSGIAPSVLYETESPLASGLAHPQLIPETRFWCKKCSWMDKVNFWYSTWTEFNV